MKYMLHALVKHTWVVKNLECTRVCYECLLSKQGWHIRDVHSL